jgi:predicted nucleic acid-binding protein
VKICLLDSSFLIDLLNEIADGEAGAALNWLRRNMSSELWISPVTLAEVLEGAEDPDSVKAYLGRYSWQGIHRVHADKVALSPIGIKEPGMFGVMEPPLGGGNRHPGGFKNGRILSCWQAWI